MPAVNESQILAALQHLVEHPKTSIRQVASLFNVSRSTLSRRLLDGLSRTTAQAHRQLLSPVQESLLVDWVLQLEQDGHAPTPATIRAMASLISVKSGGPEHVGKGWFERFRKRHPDVHTKKGVKLAQDRARMANPDTLSEWYELFHRVSTENKVPVQDWWNMDETGIQLGSCASHRVVGSSQTNKTYKKAAENREWVSIIETINTKGKHTRPLVIFKGTNVQNTWFLESNTSDWLYATSAKAWTSNYLAVEWLKQVFLPETAPVEDGGPRILLCDGHASHCSIEFMWTCYQNNVHLVYLPAHTSHVLQPLDLSVFSQIKRSYRAQIETLSALEDAAPIKKIRFVQYYHQARQDALRSKYITVGWKGAGIHPWNPGKVLNSKQLLDTRRTPPKRPRSSSCEFQTPQNKKQLLDIQKRLFMTGQGSRTQRHLHQKVAKAFDKLAFQDALQTRQIAAHERRLEETQAGQAKRGPVENPNQDFVNIEDIHRTHEEAKKQAEEAAAKEAAKEAVKANKRSKTELEKAAADAKKAAEQALRLTIEQMTFVFDVDE